MFSPLPNSRLTLSTAVFLAFFPSCTSDSSAEDTLTYRNLTMDEATGTLFIAGGGSRPLSLMEGVVNRMESKDDLVVVLPMASSEPEESLVYGIRPFVELGCTNVHGMNLHPGNWGKAQLDSIRDAKAFYLCGGDQARFMAVAHGEIAEAIREAFRRGAVISGSSAGAAMMSEVMITGDQQREPEYESTYRRLMTENGIYLDGLGLLDGAIVDQHFVERSRYNRALSALHDHPGLPVIGIGESTALVVEPSGLSVEGEGQVAVFRPGHGRSNSAGQIALSGIRLDVFVGGDQISGSQPLPH